MATLWLVRHGQTDWNVLGIYQGQSDIPLNDVGLCQAEALAAQLAGQAFEAVYSSDLSRARRTAEILVGRRGQAVEIDHRLREINQGEWEGRNYQQVVAQAAALIAEGEQDLLNMRAPGGESNREVAERMAAAAYEIARAHPAGPVLVVSHGFALATLICQARGIPMAQVYQHIIDNAHPVVIEWPPAAETALQEDRASA